MDDEFLDPVEQALTLAASTHIAVASQRDRYSSVLEQILELAQQGDGRICRTIARLASEAIEPPAEGA